MIPIQDKGEALRLLSDEELTDRVDAYMKGKHLHKSLMKIGFKKWAPHLQKELCDKTGIVKIDGYAEPIQSSLKEEKELPDWEDLKTDILQQYSDSRFNMPMPFSYNQLYAAMEEYFIQKTELLVQSSLTPKSIRDSAEKGVKDFVVIDDHEGNIEIWSKVQYEIYVSNAVKLGACPSVKVITMFNESDSYFDEGNASNESAIIHLNEVVVAANRMRDRYAEGDEAVKKDLWKTLHSKADEAREFLDEIIYSRHVDTGEASLKPNKLTDSEIEKMAEDYSEENGERITKVHEYFTQDALKSGFIAGAQAIINKQK